MPPSRTLDDASLRMYEKEITALKSAFDLVSDHVVITDSDAHILYVNRAAEETTGFPLAEMLGKNPADVWGGNMPKKTWHDAWHTMKDKKQPVVLDVRNTRKDGTEVWQALHISPVLDAQGNVRMFIGIEPNITDKKQKEQFRENFLSILSHKALGPLTGIHWFIELLCERGDIPEDQREHLLQIYGEGKELTSILADLTVLSRMGKGHPVRQKTDLRQLLREAVSVLPKQYEGRLTFAEPEQAFSLETDPILVRELFLCICESLLRQISADSSLTLALQQEKDHVVFSATASGSPDALTDESRRFLTVATLIARHLQWKLQEVAEGNVGVTIAIPVQ